MLHFLEYGSMLSCPFSESPFQDDEISSGVNIKFGLCTQEDRNTPRSMDGPDNNAVLDIDIHWEMNYHEAAIFLEVNMNIVFFAVEFYCTIKSVFLGRKKQ